MKQKQTNPKGYVVISNCKTCGAPILMESKKWNNPMKYITQNLDGSFQLDSCVYTCKCCRFSYNLGVATQPYTITYQEPAIKPQPYRMTEIYCNSSDNIEAIN